MRFLAKGQSVAYASDAGTPLVADPGYRLVIAAREAGHDVHVAPGASAVLAALSVAGLPTDRFLFLGFLPVKSAARRREIARFADIPATLVIFESPRRLAACLADMAGGIGAGRQIALVREVTKMFEEVRRGTIAELAARYAGEATPKGEIVLVIGPPDPADRPTDKGLLDRMLREALAAGSVRDAATTVAAALGLARREVYARALEISRGA